jgi:hypothetical protein
MVPGYLTFQAVTKGWYALGTENSNLKAFIDHALSLSKPKVSDL